MALTEVSHRSATRWRIDPELATVAMEPLSDGAGSWVGCPTVLYEPDDRRFWLSYRHRRPRGEGADRGWKCGIATSIDGVEFEEVWSIEKGELGASSMERFCLIRDPVGDGYLLYVSYVDPADNRWRIDVVSAKTPMELDITERREVLTAASTGTEGVKDPFVVRVGPAVYLFASFASADQLADDDRERAHAEADIYNAGVTIHPTGLATSIDGRSFAWQGEVLGVGKTWDRYQARLSTIVPCDGMFVGFYDGSSGAHENYEERAGYALSHDLRTWHRVTPDGPCLTSAHGSGSLRYFTAAQVGADLYLYYECARPDGSHDLRLTRLPGC
jgi:hypothetical protein